ncbi:MAG: hypothetical protein ACTSQC_11315, partial [Candidatus Heimdallarchaeaceae archaeon]
MPKELEKVDLSIHNKAKYSIILLYISLFSSITLAILYIIAQTFGFFSYYGALYETYTYHTYVPQVAVVIFGIIAGISLLGFI